MASTLFIWKCVLTVRLVIQGPAQRVQLPGGGHVFVLDGDVSEASPELREAASARRRLISQALDALSEASDDLDKEMEDTFEEEDEEDEEIESSATVSATVSDNHNSQIVSIKSPGPGVVGVGVKLMSCSNGAWLFHEWETPDGELEDKLRAGDIIRSIDGVETKVI